MGFWSSLGSAISSFVSGAVSVVSNAIKSVGKAVVETAKEFLQVGIDKLKTVVEILEIIAKALGIIKPEEDAEELGDKAMRADKKPEDFDSINEYIEYLRNEIKSSREEFEKLSPEERLARKAVGSALLAKAIEEKKSLEIPVEFWNEAVRVGLNSKEIDQFLDKFKKAGVSPSDFVKYLKRELESRDESKMDSVLIQAYKELEPTMDEKDIEEKVVRLQSNG